MYINLQILLGAFLSTVALASRVSISIETDHSSRTTVDDDNNISTPFTLTSNGRAVGYGTVEAASSNYMALVLQPPGVQGSTFTLVEGQLITSDNMLVCRYYREDLSLLPKKLYAAPNDGGYNTGVSWQASDSGDVLNLLKAGAPSPILRKGASPEGLDWLFFPLIGGNPTIDLTISEADDSSNSFLINQESRGSQRGYGAKNYL